MIDDANDFDFLGASTLSSKECFYPQIFVFDDGTRGILYQVYLAQGDMLLQGITSRTPKT